jgi:phosphoribosylamine--glycine ligase
LFHAGTEKRDKKIYAVGGRVLNFVGLSKNFADAKKNVMNNLKKLDWSEGFYRKDIGHKVLK